MAGLSGFLLKLKTPLVQSTAEQAALPDIADFKDIGGFRSNTFTINTEAIDITNKSSGENRLILQGRGPLMIDMNGEGIVENSVIQKSIEQSSISQKLRWFLLQREDGRMFIARFKITTFNQTGGHNTPITFTINLLSSGTIYIRDGMFAYDTGVDRITAFAGLINPFNYYLYASPEYYPSQLPASGAARTAALKARLNALAAPANAAKIAGNPANAITLKGPVPPAAIATCLLYTSPSPRD